MEPKRQREITLAIIALLLAVAAYTAYRTLSGGQLTSSTAPASSKSGSAAGRKAGGNAVKSGEVDYVVPPEALPEDRSCLTCICKPKGDLVLDA